MQQNTIVVPVDDELKAALLDMAKQSERSLAGMVRFILREAVERDKPEEGGDAA